MRTLPKHFALRLRRSKRLEPLMVPEKISLAEANARRLEVQVTDLRPEDVQKVCGQAIGVIDDLPPEVRHALKNQTWGRVPVRQAAARLLAGHSVSSVVSWIDKENADFTEIQRKKGLIP